MNARWDSAGQAPALTARTGKKVLGRVLLRLPAAWLERVILIGALSLFTLALAPSLQETGTPPGWDQSVHLRDSLVYERLLRDPAALSFDTLLAILRGSEDYPLLTPSGYYPPLVPGVTALLYRVAGRSYEVAMATNVLFLALLLAGTWGLGNRMLGRPAGILASLLLLAAPGIRLNAGEYMLDLPLAVMVVLSTWTLLGTEGFSRRGRSVAFGALCGAGMLTKWSFLLFLAAPVVLVLLSAAKESRRGGGSVTGRRVNLALALLAAALVAAPYYAPILPILVRKTLVHAGGAADGFTSPFTPGSLLFHLEALPRKLMGWPLSVTVAAGILLLPWRRGEARRAGLFLGVWALSLYALFTFAVVNKQSRYLLPWLPVLVTAGAGGIADLWRRRGPLAKPGRVLACLLLALPLAGLPGGWRPESAGDWQVRAMVERLEKDLPPRLPEGKPAWRMGVLPDMRRINGPTVAYYVSRRGLPVTVVQLVNRMKRHVSVDVGLDPFNRGDFYETFDDYDYLLTKTGENAIPPWESVVPAMQRYFEERRGEFNEVGLFHEPDGSVMTLYRRNRG